MVRIFEQYKNEVESVADRDLKYTEMHKKTIYSQIHKASSVTTRAEEVRFCAEVVRVTQL